MKNKEDIYIYSEDGMSKVNISKATLLADVLRDKNICRQGDNSQLWRSCNGHYFRGSCLQYATNGSSSYRFIPLTFIEAKRWVIDYYGASALAKFGLHDDAKEI